MRRPKQSQEGRNAATFVALLGLVVVGMGLLALVAVIFPVVILWVFIVPVGFTLLGLFHYLTWGKWLAAQTPAEMDEEDVPPV